MESGRALNRMNILASSNAAVVVVAAQRAWRVSSSVT